MMKKKVIKFNHFYEIRWYFKFQTDSWSMNFFDIPLKFPLILHGHMVGKQGATTQFIKYV